MTDCRVRIKVVEWQDQSFLATLDEALGEALMSGLDPDARQVAERVQGALRASGYPRSRVAYERSAADVLAGVAYWTVWREAPVDHAA